MRSIFLLVVVSLFVRDAASIALNGRQMFADNECKVPYGYSISSTTELVDCATLDGSCELENDAGYYFKRACFEAASVEEFAQEMAGDRDYHFKTYFVNGECTSGGPEVHEWYYTNVCALYEPLTSFAYEADYAGRIQGHYFATTDCTGAAYSFTTECGLCFSSDAFSSSLEECHTHTNVLQSIPADSTAQIANQYIGQTVLTVSGSQENEQATFIVDSRNGNIFRYQSLYVFTSPYTGAPEALSTSSFHGKARTSNGIEFKFPATVTFESATKYYFYFSSRINGEIIVLENGRKRAIDNPLMIHSSGSGYQDQTQSLSLILVSAPDDGEATADPIFLGFNNQKFEFDGTAGKFYNIYNDHWVNLNTKFGIANSKSNRGTIMTDFGLSIGEHNISVNIMSPRTSDSITLVIDGTVTQVKSSPLKLSGCVDIQYSGQALLITTPKHEIYITPIDRKGFHITNPYFNIHIHHPKEDIKKIGGVLGQTADKLAEISTEESKFTVPSLFSFSASSFYDLQSLEC